MSVEPQAQGGPEIENLFAETRTFPPDPAFAAQANATADLYDEANADYDGFWSGRPRERLSLVHAVRRDPRVGPAVRQVVHRRRAQRRLQLRRPARRARPRRQGRLPLDRRARRHPDAHLRGPHARGQQGRQRAPRARRPEGRPRRDLHADDPGAADRDARLRPDRRAAHGRLRRVLRRGAVRPHQRLRGEGPDHRRRRLAARQEGRPQAPRRRGGRRDADDRARDRRRPLRRRRPTWSRGRDDWWHDIVDRQAEDCPPVPVDSEHMLYLLYTSGTTAKPKGILHTTAGYLARHGVHPRADLRHQARRRVLVRRRHRLGDRPQLHRLRAARERDDRDPVRGRARHPDVGPLVADHRGLQGHDPVLRARPRSARS